MGLKYIIKKDESFYMFFSEIFLYSIFFYSYMVIGITLFIIAVLIIAVWVVIEMKRMRHKLFAVFLIGLILFLYISSAFVFKEQDIEWKSVSGVIKATKIYFSWLGSAFGNLRSITSYAIKMDWKINKTIEENRSLFKISPEDE